MGATRSGDPLLEHLFTSCLPWQRRARIWHQHTPTPSVPAAATRAACREGLALNPFRTSFCINLSVIPLNKSLNEPSSAVGFDLSFPPLRRQTRVLVVLIRMFLFCPVVLRQLAWIGQ